MKWLAGLALALVLGGAKAESITLASTTSTEQSGLFAFLLPRFSEATGIAVKVVALGTGQALDMGRRGDADVLLVHDPAAEERFVAEGFGLQRQPVMYNDFVLVGPLADPAGVKGGNDIVAALRKVSAANAPFVSRGDHSGTHAAELRYLALGAVPGKGSGHRACGCGMGPALNIAASTGAYALSDRGTWLGFRNRGELAVLVEGDRRLFNQYGAIVVNPARHPHVKEAAARKFVNWLASPTGQGAIAAYRINGQQLFFPNAVQ